MAAKNEITIPVSAAFEVRLAELLWENCPKIAKQMVSSKIALALNIDESLARRTLAKLIDEEMNSRVLAHVQKKVPELEKRIEAKTKECLSKIQVTGDVGKAVKQMLNGGALSDKITAMIRNAINVEVHNIVDTWLNGENKDAMARLVEGRVDRFIASVTNENTAKRIKEAQP